MLAVSYNTLRNSNCCQRNYYQGVGVTNEPKRYAGCRKTRKGTAMSLGNAENMVDRSGLICKHGSLQRQCELCERDQRIVELERELNEYRKGS
jgi:hypothetical protein